MIEILYDELADALYIKFGTDPHHHTTEVQDDVMLDFDVNGKLLGLELLNTSSHVLDPCTVNVEKFGEAEYEEMKDAYDRNCTWRQRHAQSQG